jgi:hypothetical protein
MAAATAEVTSMPVVLEPELAARILLISSADAAVVELVNADVTAEEAVLITSTYIPGWLHGVHAHPGIRVREPGT